MTTLDLFSQPTQESVTMTSLEIVEFINHHRKAEANASGLAFPCEGFAKLGHNDFMKKVPEVLGLCAGNFSHTYQVPGPNGGFRSAPCYKLPKREATLLAMSYSYALQAAVYDHMTELENALRPVSYPLPQSPIAEKLQVADMIATALRYSESSRLGIVANAVRIAAPQHLDLLPSYAVDAPAGSITAGSSEVTHSLTHLLKTVPALPISPTGQ